MAMLDMPDAHVSHAVFSGDGRRCVSGGKHGSYVANIVCPELGRRASLFGLVPVVVGGCSDAQMGRVYARRVIAGVQHLASCGHWAVCQLVGQAVCSQLFAVLSNHAVSVSVKGAFPRPARRWVSRLVVAMKLHVERFWRVSGLRGASAGAELALAVGDRGGPRDEWRAAVMAQASDGLCHALAAARVRAEAFHGWGGAHFAGVLGGSRHRAFYHVASV